MPPYDAIRSEADAVIAHCQFKHIFGCGCWRHSPEWVAYRKRDIRRRLGLE